MAIQRILGRINKRFDVGYNTATGDVFILGSSNYMEFTVAEMNALLTIFQIASVFCEDTLFSVLSRKHIELWEPATPPATVTL